MLWLKFTGCLADASQDLWLLVLLYQNRVFLWLSAWQCEGHEVFGDAIAEIITGGVFCKKQHSAVLHALMLEWRFQSLFWHQVALSCFDHMCFSFWGRARSGQVAASVCATESYGGQDEDYGEEYGDSRGMSDEKEHQDDDDYYYHHGDSEGKHDSHDEGQEVSWWLWCIAGQLGFWSRF